MLDPDQESYLRESVALMRLLGVVTWNGITLGLEPRPVPVEDIEERAIIEPETMAAKKRRLFYGAAK